MPIRVKGNPATRYVNMNAVRTTSPAGRVREIAGLCLILLLAFGQPSHSWTTFLGASNTDDAAAIVRDSTGNIYAAGSSESGWGMTIVRGYVNNYDGYVAKFDNGGALVWVAFLGGMGADFLEGLAVDGIGNIYVVGYSDDAWGAPVNGFEHSGAGTSDISIVKLDGNGTVLWHAFFGGNAGADYGCGIAVDASGNVYVSGSSDATWGSPLRVYAGGSDAFVLKMSGAGQLLWHTFLGSGGQDYSYGLSVNGGNLCVSGASDLNWGTPVRTHAGGMDAFATRLDTNSGTVLWNTFVGSPAQDMGRGVAVDGSGSVYLGGISEQTWGSPVRDHGGAGVMDAFAARLDAGGNLSWNTFVGGAGNDYSYGLTDDSFGHVYLGGYSDQSWGIPIRAYAGGMDAFVAEMDKTSGLLNWHMFFGSPNQDVGVALAADMYQHVYLAGWSMAAWGTPIRSYSGGKDGFAIEVVVDFTSTPTPSMTSTVTHTCTITPTATPSVTPSYTQTPSPTFSLTPSVTPSLSPTCTLIQTATPTVTHTSTPSATGTPSPTSTPAGTMTWTCSPTTTLTSTRTSTPSPVPETPTTTPSPVPETPTTTPSPVPETPTTTPSPSATEVVDVMTFTPTTSPTTDVEMTMTPETRVEVGELTVGQNVLRPGVVDWIEIRYRVDSIQPVRAKIFNQRGRLVATLMDGEAQTGFLRLRWEGRDDRGNRVGSGVYVLSFRCGSLEERRKLVVVR